MKGYHVPKMKPDSVWQLVGEKRASPPLLRAYLMTDLCLQHRNRIGNMLKAKYNRSEGQEHCSSLKNTRAACDKGTDDTPSSMFGSRGRAPCLVSLLMHLSGI